MTQQQRVDRPGKEGRLNLEKIATELRNEGTRLLSAAAALDGGKKKPGRVLSKDARARIGDAQRKRWAAVRKAAKKAA
jgi:hypothetical protein